ncbi:MarR family winged helix-turn-helix transcriptional regulator [Tanticharoenia sakaeratensis]|nr:MarR family transcriptional regulator [Tanticharoenia sakaeratensis]
MSRARCMIVDTEPAAIASGLRAALGALKRRLRAQGASDDLSSAQIALLSRLDRDGPATVTTLAQAEAMRPQSMGAHVASLEARGFVRREADPQDRRQFRIVIEQAARDELARQRTAREDWLVQRIAETLSESERSDLARAVVLLERLAGI